MSAPGNLLWYHGKLDHYNCLYAGLYRNSCNSVRIRKSKYGKLPDTYCSSWSMKRIEYCVLTFYSKSVGLWPEINISLRLTKALYFFGRYYKIFWKVKISRCRTRPGHLTGLSDASIYHVRTHI